MPARILVIDDEAHILQVLSYKLRSAGYEVITAVDGEQGLEVAAAQSPDLIITAFQMRYLNGLELCRALAEQEGTRHIPVLILTADDHVLEQDDLDAGNVRGVLSKPFRPRSLLELVERQLKGPEPEPGRATPEAA